MRQNEYKESIQKIEEFMKNKRLTQRCSNEDMFNPLQREVTYNATLNYRNRIYSILHELGHFVLGTERLQTAKEYKLRQVDDIRRKRSMRYRIEVQREEIEAWDVGFALSKDLGLDIDYDSYITYASHYIGSYCDWISERDYSHHRPA